MLEILRSTYLRGADKFDEEALHFLGSRHNWFTLAMPNQPAQCLDSYGQHFFLIIEFGMVVALYYRTAKQEVSGFTALLLHAVNHKRSVLGNAEVGVGQHPCDRLTGRTRLLNDRDPLFIAGGVCCFTHNINIFLYVVETCCGSNDPLSLTDHVSIQLFRTATGLQLQLCSVRDDVSPGSRDESAYVDAGRAFSMSGNAVKM